MPNESKEISLREVVDVRKASGDIKEQYVVSIQEWDTSKMANFSEGATVYTGHSLVIQKNKLGKFMKSTKIFLDPSSKELRDALFNMYASYDALVGKK